MIKPHFTVVLAPGDGPGPGIFRSARPILDHFARSAEYEINFHEVVVGGASIDRHGTSLTDDTLSAALRSDAILLGPVGGPSWTHFAPHDRPGECILRLRDELDLFANIRPVTSRRPLVAASPLRPTVFEGIDLVFVRELLGGLYRGQPSDRRVLNGIEVARDTQLYAATEVDRIAEIAFRLAETRNGRICSIDKESMLATGGLWRDVVERTRTRFPHVELRHMHVDTFAAQLVQQPSSFDVILADNMFGDILSDAAAGLVGIPAILPTASLGPATNDGRRLGLYEPMHAALNADAALNPIGLLLAFALLLRHSLHAPSEAAMLERAVTAAIDRGLRTADIASRCPGLIVTADEFCAVVLDEIERFDSTGIVSPTSQRSSEDVQ